MTLPATTFTIDPSVRTWSETWSDGLLYWRPYGPAFQNATVHHDAVLGNYINGPVGSPSKKWDKNKPISIYHAFRVLKTGFNICFYSGEAEYWGIVANYSTLQYYYNASYSSGLFNFSAGQVLEVLLEFDGNQTTTLKARVMGSPSWSNLGSYIFKPTVHPTLQINEWNGGSIDRGTIQVAGSEVWGWTDIADRTWWWPQCSNTSVEWGYEFVNSNDYGKTHYLPFAGGITLAPNPPGNLVTWTMNANIAYDAGSFQSLSPYLLTAAGFKYGLLELIGSLRQGSSLSVSICKANGALVPSSELGGAANPVTFTTAAAEKKTVDLSGIVYDSIYLQVDGSAPSATTKTWPDAAGTKGPPILKQAQITLVPGTLQSSGNPSPEGSGSLIGTSVAATTAAMTGTGIALGAGTLSSVSAATSVKPIVGVGVASGTGYLSGVSAATAVSDIEGIGIIVNGINQIRAPDGTLRIWRNIYGDPITFNPL